MTDMTRRGFLLGGAAVIAAPKEALAQACKGEFRQNKFGTNVIINFAPEHVEIAKLFSNKAYAEVLGNALITAERKRRRKGGSPCNDRPNSSEYEKSLTRALKSLNINGAEKIAKMATVLTEENSKHHLSRAPKGSSIVTIRFSSSPEGIAAGGDLYERDLNARVSANGHPGHQIGNKAFNFAPARTGNQFTP
jgi:hypothetical protein